MQLISGWMQDTYGLNATTTSAGQQIMQAEVPQQTSIIGQVESYVSIGFSYLQNMWNAFWFHPEMFTGSWATIWWIFFFPVGAAMAVGVIMVLRGVPNF